MEAVSAAGSCASSRIAYVECKAAISRAEREGRLASKEADKVNDAFDRSWPDIHVVEVTEDLARDAGDLTRQHHLRAGDAIHLASANLLLEVDPAELMFACWDHRLWTAANSRGYRMLPDNDPP